MKKAARADYLTAPTTRGAANRAGTGLSTAALAFIAGVEFRDFNLFFDAERRLLKLDLHVVTQIGATLSIFGAPPTAEERLENSAADSASAKDFTENVEWIVKTATTEAGALRKGCMPKPIVGRVFIRIDKDIVCLAEFLEPFLGMRIVGIFIWMKLDRELAIRALDLLLRGVAPHAQNFVIIAFGRGHFLSTADYAPRGDLRRILTLIRLHGLAHYRENRQ